MERLYPECGPKGILQTRLDAGYRHGHDWHRNFRAAVLVVAVVVGALVPVASGAQERVDSGAHSTATSHSRWIALFASGFASSILAHESAHVIAAYAVGGKPSFGLDEGRPTIYSGIDARLEPHKQFVFSSAGLTVQSVIDEGILDAPHGAGRAGPFERGVLAGGIATSLFYVTIGRNGSVSDVAYMARTSSLSKTTLTFIYGGTALLHVWRITHNSRYADFFARPAPSGGLHIGVDISPR